MDMVDPEPRIIIESHVSLKKKDGFGAKIRSPLYNLSFSNDLIRRVFFIYVSNSYTAAFIKPTSSTCMFTTAWILPPPLGSTCNSSAFLASPILEGIGG